MFFKQNTGFIGFSYFFTKLQVFKGFARRPEYMIIYSG